MHSRTGGSDIACIWEGVHHQFLRSRDLPCLNKVTFMCCEGLAECAGASARVPRAQGYRNEEQRGESASQVMLPHLPINFPDVHQQDDGILVDQPRYPNILSVRYTVSRLLLEPATVQKELKAACGSPTLHSSSAHPHLRLLQNSGRVPSPAGFWRRVFTSAAQMLTDILPSTLITVPAPSSPGDQRAQPRPHSALPANPPSAANQPLHHTLFRAPENPAPHETPSTANMSMDTRVGRSSWPQMQWAWLEPAVDAADERRPQRPMGRSHSVPTHLPAHLHAATASDITGAPSMLSAALQRGSPHSQAAASAAAAEPAPGAAQMEDWAQAPKQAQEEPNLAAAPDLATAPDLGQEQLLGRARDEVLLISAGSAHLDTGTGLLAAVTQEHSPWATPGAEP